MSRDEVFDVIEMDAADLTELPETDPLPAAEEGGQEGKSTEDATYAAQTS
jgi:hypothetical protein